MSSFHTFSCLPSAKKQKHDLFFHSMYHKTIIRFRVTVSEPETSVYGQASCEVFVYVRVTFFKQRHIQATTFPYLFFDWFSGFSL